MLAIPWSAKYLNFFLVFHGPRENVEVGVKFGAYAALAHVNMNILPQCQIPLNVSTKISIESSKASPQFHNSPPPLVKLSISYYCRSHIIF
jgi:hypothetical protein